jgi:hypothetical protein
MAPDMTKGRQPMTAKRILVLAVAMIGGPACFAGVLNITNGAAAGGHLDIGVDDFGSYGDYGGAIQDDLFQPTGFPRYESSFTAGAMVFCSGGSGGTSANLLSGIASWKADLGGGVAGTRPLTLTVTTPNVLDSASSCHSVFQIADAGNNRKVRFQLSQFIGPNNNGITALVQAYTLTNQGTEAVDVVFLAKHDPDLLWSTIFDDDIVSSVNGRWFMCANEPGQTSQSVALGSGGYPFNDYYFAGKQGFTPPNGAPDYAFGTDTTEWGVFGTPTTWRNNVAYVGYNIDGNSGANMGDAFMGVEFRRSLGVGAQTTIYIVRAYGTTDPRPTIPPATAVVAPGTVTSGNVASLASADANRLIMRPGIVFSSSIDPISCVVEAISPTATPTEMLILWTSQASTSSVQEKVSLYDWVAGAYVLVSTRSMTVSDVTTAVYAVPGNGSRFVDPVTRTMRARLNYRQTAIVFSYPWVARVDLFSFRPSRY